MEYRDILGDGSFFIEVQEHGIDDQRRLHPQLVELARRNNLPLVATNDTHYTHPEQYEAHDLLVVDLMLPSLSGLLAYSHLSAIIFTAETENDAVSPAPA